MNDLDKRIQEALKGASGDELEIKETHLTDDLISLFRGNNRWWNTFGLSISLVFLAIAIWCAIRFFGSDTTRLQMAWGFGFVVSCVSVGLVKIYIWMEMHTNRILREIKRVELLLIQNRK